jgi:predicted metal-dependent hydrolase
VNSLGKRYLLNLVELDASPHVELRHDRLILQVRPGTNVLKKQDIVNEFYRQQLEAAISPLIDKWERLMGVSVSVKAQKSVGSVGWVERSKTQHLLVSMVKIVGFRASNQPTKLWERTNLPFLITKYTYHRSDETIEW